MPLPTSRPTRDLTAASAVFAELVQDDDFTVKPRAVLIGGAGALTLRDARGEDTTFIVQAGAILPIRPTRIVSATTTATGIVGLF